MRKDETVELDLLGITEEISSCTATVLKAGDMHAHNTFDAPDTVSPETCTIDPTAPFTIPAAAIITLELTL